jgi:hypothetical protein
MDACVACGNKVEDGLTVCPQCGVKLSRPGGFLQMIGWVTAFASMIPLTVGIVVAEQRNFLPLAVGIAVLLLGVIFIVVGRIKINAVPPTTRPLPKVEVPLPLPTSSNKSK